MKNLEAISAALRAYAGDHGRFPPPMTVDEAGKPLFSWRVLILPYLDQQPLYNAFDLTKAWDHPMNQRAAMRMPSVYGHPNSNSAGLYRASAYYLITGPGTLFPPSGPLAPDEILDGESKTVLVVEGMPLGAGSWTEPLDLDFGVMTGLINSGATSEPGGLTEGGVAVATADGRSHLLSEDVIPRTFRALVTPAGGEPLPDDVLD